MSTKRMIVPAFWQSESIARLTLQQRYLFIGLFSNADDQGRLRGHPAVIRSMVFPYDDISIDQIANDLKAIEAIRAIIIYESTGKSCIQVTGWWKYQSLQWAYPSELPPPAGWDDRLRYRQNNQVVTKNWGDKPDTPNDLPEPPAETENEENEALGKALGKALPGPTVQNSIDQHSIDSTTNVVGDKSPEVPPNKKVKPQTVLKPDGDKKQLMGTFQTAAHMNLPGNKSTSRLWWIKISEIHEIAGGNVDLGKSLITQAVKVLKDKELTIGGPQSIVNTCRALAAGQNLGDSRNGHTRSNSTNIAGLREKGSDNPIKKIFSPATGETYWIDIRTKERVPDPGTG